MAEYSEEKQPYPCVTQDGFMPTFGLPPQDEHANQNSNGRHTIVVGMKDVVPRWTASKTSPTKLLYFVVRDGFASDADHKYTADSFQAAANQWNAIGFGVNISAAPEKALAHFLVKYYKPRPNNVDKDSGTIASAFFPNEVKEVRIYDKTLTEAKWREILMNSLLHEIGHIIGLRHEFALTARKDNGDLRESPAQRFGSTNEHSVMSYDDVNIIQESDKKDVLDFYALPNRTLLNGVDLFDYTPKPLGP
ncbi:hypothetical protein EJ04DRAFT_442969 [Polyplosphaeria fusca]|uniref:EcxA zinc-binding domain-containing protein n=1 Tax=Polyplosphaeria fusca TaxID=682080 RepID=A0A9P4QTT2_9PLEO|nr:hypothetical protein EJ04DRAFT_442969 [Polyplosphaeria fusca]